MISRLQAIGGVAGIAVMGSALIGWRFAEAKQDAFDRGVEFGRARADADHNAAVEKILEAERERIANEREASARRFADATNAARIEINRWKQAYENALSNHEDFAACDPVPVPRELRICPGNPGCKSAGPDTGRNS